jgi:hypothetical protein
MIRGRLKLMLPTVNTAVAAVLLAVGYTRPLREWAPVPWEMALSFTINAPANLLRKLVSFLWDKHIFNNCSEANARACSLTGNAVEIASFVIATFVAWYVVALGVGARKQEKRAIVPSVPALRIVVDVVLLAAAGFLAFILVMNWKSRGAVFSPFGDFGIFCYFAWALALGIPYGDDLIKCMARRR